MGGRRTCWDELTGTQFPEAWQLLPHARNVWIERDHDNGIELGFRDTPGVA
jgi:hypothetical protein